jgi:poly-gamma-glutamate synthesis protein (capsule biosynthesis protein)
MQAQEQKSVSIIFGGDVTATGRTSHFLGSNNELLYKDTKKVIGNHDYAICNLECPLVEEGGAIPKIGPNLKGPPEFASFLRDWGFTAATLANNHIMDYGEAGLQSTLLHCKTAGLTTFGAGENIEKASEALRVTINGCRISFVTAAEEEFCIALRDKAGAPPLLPIPMYQRITQERKISDFVIVIFHGGNEYYQLPRPGLQQLSRFLVDAGADAIVGHHSHVVGGYEVYRGKPIFYSLGNLLFDSDTIVPSGWNDGILLSLQLTPNTLPTFKVYPTTQGGSQPGVALKDSMSVKVVESTLEQLRAIIEKTNEECLYRKWRDFCSDRSAILSPFLNLWQSRISRKLIFILLNARILRLRYWTLNALNRIRCESHREQFLTWAEESSKERR